MTGWLLLLGAAILLVAGAELFVENAIGAARRLGVTVVAVGIVLAGAEPEELVTAVIAAVRDRPGLAVGDAVGANVTMFTACLGLAAVLRPVPVGGQVRRYALLSAAAGALAVGVLLDGRVGRVEGAALCTAYVALVAVVWWRERRPPALGELAETAAAGPRRPGVAVPLALLGVGLMAVGGELAIDGAVRVVEGLGSTDSAVGLTVLALATTAEMFALVVAAARRALAELAVAGVVGSAAYNATATLGAAALARPLQVSDVLVPAAAAAALPLLLLWSARRGQLGRRAGLLLVAGYAAYVALVLLAGS